MNRTPTTHPEPGPECICGYELKAVPLPEDLSEIAGRDVILVHVESGDTRCYPESENPADRRATAEPAEN